jgi:hypothetical protein
LVLDCNASSKSTARRNGNKLGKRERVTGGKEGYVKSGYLCFGLISKVKEKGLRGCVGKRR